MSITLVEAIELVYRCYELNISVKESLEKIKENFEVIM